MLSAFYIALRFIHFTALMMLFGSTICCSVLSPQCFKSVLARRLQIQWRLTVWLSLISAGFLFIAQAGLMGDGWVDAISPDVWLAVLRTSFGSVWVGQLLLAVVTLLMSFRPRTQRWIPLFAAGQIIMLAGVGHAAMHDGLTGVCQRINHAIHLVSAAWWVGGLLPLIVCMNIARKPRWRSPAIATMMRFSRYGHLCVAAVLVTGVVNGLLIFGWPPSLESGYFYLLGLKVALVAGMVVLALVNRYMLVPRFSTAGGGAQRRFVQLTWLEVILSVVVLLLVSIFATWAPF